MPEDFFQELLVKFGPHGVLSCSCGQEHRLAVRQVLVDQGALQASADLLRRLYGDGCSLWVLSDQNTEAAAGAQWKKAMPGARIASRILPGDPWPVPTEELVQQLSKEVAALAPRLLVGIGSGVVSDLVKRISYYTNIPNWCVATAASVDAYGAAKSAIRLGGYHQAVPAHPSEVIVCDLDVIAQAPQTLFLSGLGDLVAKYLARLDWKLAGMVTGEHVCEDLSALVLRSARRALEEIQKDDCRAGRRPGPRSVRVLIDAALVSGFAMQALGGSRSAASAEHTMAHFWESTGAIKVRELELHGILVGAASRLVLRGYQAYYRQLAGLKLDVAQRLVAYDRESAWEAPTLPGMDLIRTKMAEEMHGRVFDREVLARRLEAFRVQRESVLKLTEPLLAELSGAIQLLETLDFPFPLDRLGISEPFRMYPARYNRLLRNRYTTFDLAYELGNQEPLMEGIAGSI